MTDNYINTINTLCATKLNDN